MIVVDASVAVKTYLEEPGAEAATELLTGPGRLLAPELIRLEVAGAICRRVRNGQLGAQEALALCQHWFGLLQRGLLALTPDRDLLPEAIELSVQLKHAVHDCVYLAAARRFNATLVTADRIFRDRAIASYDRISMLAGCEKN